jgi:hypothetical protein
VVRRTTCARVLGDLTLIEAGAIVKLCVMQETIDESGFD